MASEKNSEDVFLQQAIPWLQTATFKQATGFYQELMQDPGLTDYVVGEIGKADRFFLLTHILHRVDALHPWLYERTREVEFNTDGYLDLWARDHYKALDCNTPVLTRNGWKRHIDLRPFDLVASPSGWVRVIANTGVLDGADCYTVRISDGSELVAAGDHLWPILTKHKKRISGTDQRVVSYTVSYHCTRDVMGTQKRLYPETILNYPEKNLEIQPYVLGVWLGDGHSANGRITCNDDIWQYLEWDEIRNTSVNITKTLIGLTPKLRRIGVLNNKHIPQNYMESSCSQRLELLQGLMDTDGHVNTRGTATFTQKSKSISQQVCHLVRSLGVRANIREHTQKLNGEAYRYYQVSFQTTNITPFKLKRKVERCGGAYQINRFIKSVDRCETRPVNCIQVEGGEYLAGYELIPTHNSTIITFAGSVQEILKDPGITIGIFSHTRPIAKAFLNQIKLEFEGNKTLYRLYPEIIWKDPKRDAPVWSQESIVVKRTSNPREMTVEAWGVVEGQPTSKHFQLLIFDDLVTLESVTTADMILKTTNAWELAQNLGSSRRPRKWHVGTRYNFADTYGQLIKRGALETRIYPATDDGTPDGNPVFLSPEVWAQKKRESSSYTIACQQLLNPVAGSEQELKEDWLRTYEIRPHTMNVYIMCDYAGSRTSKGGSNTAMAVLGIDHNKNKYLLDGACHKMDLSERWKLIKHFRRKWIDQPGVQLVKVGYERFGAQSDIQHFEEMMRIEKDYFPIEELNWPRDGSAEKDERIRRLIPDFQNWRFFIPYDGEETRTQTEARANKQGHLIPKPIKQVNQDKRVYDVTKWWISNEFIFFPHTTQKDFLDALSRIYDMDPQPPIGAGRRAVYPEAV